MYKLIFIVTITLTSQMPLAIYARASADETSEYSLKAEFIYNFSKFTQWPDKSDQLKVCIYGRDPFGSKIDDLNDKLSNSRKIKVYRTWSLDKVKTCHIAFVNINHMNDRYYKNMVRRVNNANVLTIADDNNAVDSGVMIGLVMNNDKLSFDINDAVVSKSTLTISSKLLRLAREVK